jgi:N-acylneuraminate cytidylyltransferase
MSTIAVIPARGGSKGLPRKNVRPVGGTPLVARTVETACSASTIDGVFVSTDDPEIAGLAAEAGAGVIDRPASLSGDEASSESALLHALDHLPDSAGPPDLLAFLQCTAPFTTPGDVDGTVARLRETGADTAFAAAPFHGFVWREAENGTVAGANHDAGTPRARRQDRAREYVEAGSVYVMRASGFRTHEHRFFGRTVAYEVPAERHLEIDTAADLRRAEARAARLHRQQRADALPDPVDAVVFDFDGVFTDNRVFVFEDEREAVLCDRGDGMGISRLRDRNLHLLVLSSEVNPVVQARTDKLDLETLHGVDDKPAVLNEWLRDRDVAWERTVFVGNDVNDVGCLRQAGCGVVVADAYDDAKAAADLVLSRKGGDRAVRELCDLILAARSSTSAP